MVTFSLSTLDALANFGRLARAFVFLSKNNAAYHTTITKKSKFDKEIVWQWFAFLLNNSVGTEKNPFSAHDDLDNSVGNDMFSGNGGSS